MDHSYHQKIYILKCRFDFQVSNSSTLIHQMELTYVSYCAYIATDGARVPARARNGAYLQMAPVVLACIL